MKTKYKENKSITTNFGALLKGDTFRFLNEDVIKIKTGSTQYFCTQENETFSSSLTYSVVRVSPYYVNNSGVVEFEDMRKE